MSEQQLHTGRWAVGVFVMIYVVYVTSPVVTSFDSRWAVATSVSLYTEGNADLNEFGELLDEAGYYAIEEVDGRYYSYFPVTAAALAAPFVFIGDLCIEPTVAAFPAIGEAIHRILADFGYPVEELNVITLYRGVELLIASLFTALSAVLIFLLARARLSLGISLFIVFIYAFCTSSWSTASRALWQHGPSMLMLAGALYLLVRGQHREELVKYAAIPLALAFMIRPTNAISVALLSSYVLLNHRRQFIPYLLLALPFGAAFFAYNLATYGQLMPSYFNPQRLGGEANVAEALAGNLVSPARGLFVYSPVLLLCLVPFVSRVRDRLLPWLGVIILLHWLAVSSYYHWWGGHSYGPRFMTDMLPYLVYLLMLGVDRLFPREKKWPAPLLASVLALVLVSFAMHYLGSHHRSVYDWNSYPVNVDDAPERIWDWRDPQFAR